MRADSLFEVVRTTWNWEPLGEVCRRGGGNIQTGPFGSQLHASDYVDTGVPSIMPQNITEDRVNPEGIARISPSDAERLARYLVKSGDIVYSRRGDVERRALITGAEDGWLCGTGCLRVRFGEGVVDPIYGSYFLSHPASREWVVRHAVGATMPNLNTSILAALPFLMPPLDEQRAIASVLGALDDKIEQNRRTAQALEKLARAIFRAWFVDFEPVKAKAAGATCFPSMPQSVFDALPTRLADSAIGPVPEGWQVKTVNDLCDYISSGGTPARRRPEFWADGTIDWFKTGELQDGPLLASAERITEKGLGNSSAKLWPSGTVLFALYASPTVGRLGVLTRPGTSNQAAAGLIARAEVGVSFLMSALIEARAELQRIAVGAAQQNINQGVLKSHQMVLPPPKFTRAYSEATNSALEMRIALAKEAAKLSEMRDYLLPKLLSGQIRVRDAERAVATAT